MSAILLSRVSADLFELGISLLDTQISKNYLKSDSCLQFFKKTVFFIHKLFDM